MKNIRFKLPLFIIGIGIFIVASGVFVYAQFSQAQTYEEQQQEILQQQQDLQNQLKELENQIKQYQVDLKNIQGQKNTLQNKISQLNNEQSTLELQLKTTNLQIDNLNLQLNSTRMSMEKNETKSESLKTQMSVIINSIYQNDNYPLIYTIFRQGGLTDIMNEIESASQFVNSLSIMLAQNKQIKDQLQAAEELLSQQVDEVENLKKLQNLQIENISASVGEQKGLLQKTKGQESAYQQDISDAKKEVQTIKNRIYSLLEVQKQINFGQAVTIAQWAGSQTGVRAAFLLAVLSQESSLGKNVGTCNRAGDPPSKSYKVVMKPTRDIEPFLEITKALGMDPDKTPISCPMHDKQGNQIGWGGALGPAQFIPSTWQGYAGKVTAITGKPANPWDIRDAFLAAAIKLGNDGATSQSGEWAAAMRYFSGSTNPAYSFYGDSVVAKAEQYQKDIDQISN